MDGIKRAMNREAVLSARHGGSLSTARCALRVLALLEGRPEGVRADEVATVIGKSRSTAYDLLNAICDEGFAAHDPHRGVYHARAAAPVPPGSGRAAEGGERSLAALADEVFARTHKRSYVGVLRNGAIEIVEVRGKQGMARQPGLGDRISDLAHATAMGKVVLSLLKQPAADRYLSYNLRQVAPATVCDPALLREQLAQTRRQGYAVDVEELAEGFCCIAAPVFGADSKLRAIVGISMTPQAFETCRDDLAETLCDVAATKLMAPLRPPVPATLEEVPVS
jgi:DNA-binding IclR family transcriptional regulator